MKGTTRCPWRAAVCLVLALASGGCVVSEPKGGRRLEADPCAGSDVSISYQSRVLKVVRIYTGADGVSHADIQEQPAEESTYLGALLRQYPFGDPSNVVLVSGPPNFHIPRHPAPYREMFVLLSGSSVIELSDGTTQPLRAGSVALFEDVTGPGHAGLFGPCGYVAVDIQFKPPQPATR